MSKGLGRHPSPDERDENYLLREVVPRTSLDSLPTYKYWTPRVTLDQGNTPRCVGFSWKSLLANTPVPRPVDEDPSAPWIYNYAQEHDAWPGTNYEGTSTRAGAKACVAAGKVSVYRWAQTMEDFLTALFLKGSLVVGTVWRTGMFDPDPETSFIKPTGADEGGHCYRIIGGNRIERKLRIANTWGWGWGDAGKAWITFDDFEYLFIERGGEACAPTEV